MFRCAPIALLLGAFAASAGAQIARMFPQQALRGELAVTQAPDVTLNGRPARFAPGVRIRNQENRFVVWGSIGGYAGTVHYTLDNNGELREIWLLTDVERAKNPWPRTPAEAVAWTFDPNTQTWSRP